MHSASDPRRASVSTAQAALDPSSPPWIRPWRHDELNQNMINEKLFIPSDESPHTVDGLCPFYLSFALLYGLCPL
ncbi:hypothetical protein U9M48_005543 [Paspalum notatum var. saurae]|uniref:Uncharacterized protein n=1 Tax=Paspalum notatum var. saurae TaxID=547442 RepID=A0AAQ3SK32_PASNO